MFGNIGLPELLFVFVIILLIFGAGRISEIGKGLGEGVANFIKGIRSAKEDLHASTRDETETKKRED